MPLTLTEVVLTILPVTGTFLIELILQTNKEIENWYSVKLRLPKYRLPPDWLFGPVWFFLYMSIGYASHLIYEESPSSARNLALALYASQLIINWTWPAIFFKYHRLGTSTFWLLILTMNVAACTSSFYSLNQNAGYFMMPYMIWLCFGSFISFWTWALNRDRKFE